MFELNPPHMWMSSSLSSKELIFLPQPPGPTGMLLTMLSTPGDMPHHGLSSMPLQQPPPPVAMPVPSPTRVTSTHMPSALCDKLIQLCNQYHGIISDNGNSMDCRMKRRNLWLEISKQLNSEFNVEFTADQYKKKYQNLKTAYKVKMANMSTQNQPSTRQVSPDSRRDSQPSAAAAAAAANQPVTPIDVKPDLAIPSNTSPSSPVPTTNPLLTASIPNLINFPSSSLQNLASLIDKSHPFLALAQQLQSISSNPFFAQKAPPASTTTTTVAEGLSLPALFDSARSAHAPKTAAHMAAFYDGGEHEAAEPSQTAFDRPGSVETVSGELGASVAPFLRSSSPNETEAAGLRAENTCSTTGSATASDAAVAALSSLPHISPQQHDEDPARIFCLSLADPMRRIREQNAALYVQLKRSISDIVFNAEMDSVKAGSVVEQTPRASRTSSSAQPEDVSMPPAPDA